MRESETSATIDLAAAAWVDRIYPGPLTDREQADFDDWLTSDIRHLGAFVRTRAVMIYARRLGEVPPADAGAQESSADDLPANEYEEPSRRRFLAFGASAAVVIGAVLAAGVSWQSHAQTYSTEVGEMRLISLPDGSRVTLNTATAVRVSFSDRERHVVLSAGEALFDVAKDPNRPFIVTTDGLMVRAVVTSFNVRRMAGRQVQIIVRNGAVKVEQDTGSTTKSWLLDSNASLTTGSGQPANIRSLDQLDVDQRLAWREGMLAFEDTTLAQAAEEFSRYSNLRILMESDSVGRLTVTGLYAASDPDGFARSLELSLGIKATRTADAIILTDVGMPTAPGSA